MLCFLSVDAMRLLRQAEILGASVLPFGLITTPSTSPLPGQKPGVLGTATSVGESGRGGLSKSADFLNELKASVGERVAQGENEFGGLFALDEAGQLVEFAQTPFGESFQPPAGEGFDLNEWSLSATSLTQAPGLSFSADFDAVGEASGLALGASVAQVGTGLSEALPGTSNPQAFVEGREGVPLQGAGQQAGTASGQPVAPIFGAQVQAQLNATLPTQNVSFAERGGEQADGLAAFTATGTSVGFAFDETGLAGARRWQNELPQELRATNLPLQETVVGQADLNIEPGLVSPQKPTAVANAQASIVSELTSLKDGLASSPQSTASLANVPPTNVASLVSSENVAVQPSSLPMPGAEAILPESEVAVQQTQKNAQPALPLADGKDGADGNLGDTLLPVRSTKPVISERFDVGSLPADAAGTDGQPSTPNFMTKGATASAQVGANSIGSAGAARKFSGAAQAVTAELNLNTNPAPLQAVSAEVQGWNEFEGDFASQGDFALSSVRGGEMNGAMRTESLQTPTQSQSGQVATQVAAEIARNLKNGQTHFQMRFDPPELGRVEVNMRVGADGGVQAHLVVERPETLDMFLRDQRGLERALEAAGLNADSSNLEFSLKQDGNQDFASDDQQGRGTPGLTDGDAEGADGLEAADVERVRLMLAEQRGGLDLKI